MMASRTITFSRFKFYRNLVKQRTDKDYIIGEVRKKGILCRARNILPYDATGVIYGSMIHTHCHLRNEKNDTCPSDNSKIQHNKLFDDSPDVANLDKELKATMKQYQKAREEVEARLSGKKKVAQYKPEGALHVPVLLGEVLDCFRHLENKVILDMTFGSGGHSKAILEMFPDCHIYALDRDPAAFQLANNLCEAGSYAVTPMLGRFSDLPKLLSSRGVKLNSIGGVLMDLGASSMQFDQPERGFSLSMNGPLDMRMDMNRNLVKQRTDKDYIIGEVRKKGILCRARNILPYDATGVIYGSMIHTHCHLRNEKNDTCPSDNSKIQHNKLFDDSPDVANLDKELKATMKQYQKAREEVEARLSGKKKVAQYKPEGALHVPVLLGEVLDCFRHLENKVILDMTFGSGGHSKAILEMFPDCHMYALDRDPAAFQLANNLCEAGSYAVTPMLGRFSDLPKLLSSRGVKLNSIGGVLMDLGASSMQFDQPERGFSLSMNGPLDMRMDMNRNESTPTAADVINSLGEADLTLILKKYGEEKRAAVIAHGIVEARSAYGRITTTHQLADIVEAACQGGYGTDKLGRVSHPATKTFQALRIFVNNELNELDIGLRVAHKYLQKRGVCVAIAFHSLEEKLVKNHFYNIHIEETHEKYFQNRSFSRTRSAAVVHSVEDLTKLTERNWKPFENGAFTPRDNEIKRNPRSRSAVMYAASKSM